VNPEAIRASALAVLSPHADARARGAIARGELVVVKKGDASWEGAKGPVTGLKVGLGLSAFDLGGLVDADGVKDAVVAAMASAVANEEGSALAELVLFWSPAAQVETGHYRGALGPSDLGRAVVDFLRGRGDGGAEAFARMARFTPEGDRIRVDPPPPAELAASVRACLDALLVRISPP